MRPTIGIIAAVLFAGAFFLRDPGNDTLSAAGGACLRVGIVMALWWFAFPQVERIPRWLAFATGLALFVVLLRPKLILVAIPLLVVLWFLGPRAKRRKTDAP
jgi:hypothetical protein